MIFTNAFSIQMISDLGDATVNFKPLTVSMVKDYLGNGYDMESSIGHETLVPILNDLLKLEVPVTFNRSNTKLQKGDKIVVAQYCGGRLPEGVTTLPPDAEIKFFLVTIALK